MKYQPGISAVFVVVGLHRDDDGDDGVGIARPTNHLLHQPPSSFSAPQPMPWDSSITPANNHVKMDADQHDTSTYDRDMADLLGSSSSSRVHDDEEETFAYPGADQRPDFLKSDHVNGHNGEAANDDEEDFLYTNGTSHDDSDVDDYAARIKAILGSDEDVDDHHQEHDASIQDPDMSNLPDQTLDSIPSTSDPSRFRFKTKETDHDLHPSRSLSPSTSSTSFTTRRPAQYPALSRLRSQGIRASSDTLASPLANFASRFASSDSPQRSTSSLHSPSHLRSLSTSTSTSAGPSKSFPYGPQLQPSQQHHILNTPTSSQPPAEHEVFRWSALRRTSLFFDKRPSNGTADVTSSSGQPLPPRLGRQSAFTIGTGLIAIGTSTGHTLVFEFSQELKCICSLTDTSAGRVTALAFSSDHTFLAVGHAQGHIYIYNLAKPTTSARSIPPIESLQEVTSGRKEGHLIGSKILHLAFVGTRHTAIYSADVHGLSFYHSLGKILGVASNDTLRVLGKYPSPVIQRTNPVLAMDALPLGPIPHPSDSNHFLALMSHTKLVVVGIKPNPRTWYRRATHPSEKLNGSTPNGTINGTSPSQQSETHSCCSWFPAYQASEPSPCTDANGFAPPRLAFSFGSRLFLLHLTARQVTRRIPTKDGHTEQSRTELEFSEQTLLDESHDDIHGIRWISHDILLLITANHVSLFDLRRGAVTEREPIEPTLHGLLRQTWSEKSPSSTTLRSSGILNTSVQTHQGKAFFLTTSQVIVGHPLTWTDRLLALVSRGDFLSAISLATRYHKGQIPGSVLGLSSDASQAQEQVASKLRQLMSASARYAFSPDRLIDNTHVSADGRGVDRTDLFCNLARLCAEACLSLQDTEFLFGDLYDLYTDNGIDTIFVKEMEPFVLDGRLSQLPIPVVQRLINSCKANEEYELAEKLIWHVDPTSLDLDQALSLCLSQKLYHALIHVYNGAMQDYVSPVVELFQPLKKSMRRAEAEDDEAQHDDAYTIYSYLSVIFSGQSFPSQEPMEESRADKARASLYGFIFSGHCMVWPPGGGGRLILTQDKHGDEGDEPTFPYLRLLLRFDAEAFLDALDVAFEDSYLDDDEDNDDKAPTHTTRQSIVDVLIEVTPSLQESHQQHKLTHAPDEETTFICIFLARNAPKYPQFIRLSPTTVHRLLVSLCTRDDSDDDTRQDRQLACESLLSAYKVEMTDEVLDLFDQAGFWRILRSAYRSAGKWGQLTLMILNDVDLGMDVFPQLNQVLRKASNAARGQKQTSSDLDSMVFEAVPTLVKSSADQTARSVDEFYADRHEEALEVLEGMDMDQLAYLDTFFEGEQHHEEGALPVLDKSHLSQADRDLYVRLLAKHRSEDVIKVLDASPVGFFDLDEVIECGTRHDCLDAVLWAYNARDAPWKAFDALDGMVAAKALAMRQVDTDGDDIALQTIVEQVRRASQMALRICTERREDGQAHDMWYRLLRSSVRLVHHVGADSQDARNLVTLLVQDTLSSMVTSMSGETSSFPALFRRLVEDRGYSGEGGQDNTAGYTYAEVRVVISGMLTACKLRSDLLGIANQLYDRESVGLFSRLVRGRKRGWRAIPTTPMTTNKTGLGRISLPPPSQQHGSLAMTRHSQSQSSLLTPSAVGHSASSHDNSITSKPPSRGMDFLALTPSPHHPHSNGSVATPKVDKGKGRDRSSDTDYQRGRRGTSSSNSSSSVDQQLHGGDGDGEGEYRRVRQGGASAEDEGEDYFGPSSRGEVSFGHGVVVSTPAPMQQQEDGTSNEEAAAQDGHGGDGEDGYMYARVPMSVRLG